MQPIVKNHKKGCDEMARKRKERLFADYYDEWIDLYKEGAIADLGVRKYRIAAQYVREFCPKLCLSDLNRVEYQKLINWYALTHEKQTTKDFHHQVKAAILDAHNDGLIDHNPCHRIVLKGKEKKERKTVKFLEKDELAKLLRLLDLTQGINLDWLILIAAKTGLRYAEVLGLTPSDFDWRTNTLSVNKTWAYKGSNGHFSKTKNQSSNRTIKLDWQIVGQFKPLLDDLPPDEPIFIEKFENGLYKRVHNSTINNRLKKLCKKAGIPIITCHSLRHTHASVLLAEGISIHTISARLGHSDISTTQETYTHILKELEQKDDQKMMAALMQLA